MDPEWLAEPFEADRARLPAVAYRILGSASEADDAVQEAWLRLSRTDTKEVENLSGWLTTAVAHVCLDVLLLDGLPGVVWAHQGRPRVVVVFTIENGRITFIEHVADPERVSRMRIELLA